MPLMSGSLFDGDGRRKYLVSKERQAFIATALRRDKLEASFCVALAISGARISEMLALTSNRVDLANGALVVETLKRRRRGIFRAVPVPIQLLELLLRMPSTGEQRIWPWCRTKAWMIVKSVMREAEIADALCKPKALRHAFGVEAGQNSVPLNMVQRWLGHARIETTSIYANAIGEEERNLARRTWKSIGDAIFNILLEQVDEVSPNSKPLPK